MIGEGLRLIRVFRDMKRFELSQRLDISPSYISEIESGKKEPSEGLILKYANLFETTPNAIKFFAESCEDVKEGNAKQLIRRKLIKFMQVIEKVTEEK